MPCGRCASGSESSDACDETRTSCIVSGENRLDKSSVWTAYEARDYVYVGGAEAELKGMGVTDPTGSDASERYGFPLVFGCQTEATGWYASQVHDGIAGLSSAKTSFVNQMVFQDKLKYSRFTMCFQKGTTGGLVTLGGFNPKTLDSPMVYAQNEETEGKTAFKVFVRNVYLREGGGQSVVSDEDAQSSSMVKLNFDANAFNAGNGGTIVDSGLPLLVFDQSIQAAFLMEWKKMVGTEFSFGKLVFTEEDVLRLPTLILQIKAHDGVDKSFDPNTVPSMAGERDPQNPFDVMIAIPATNYLEYIPATGTYRSKITLDSKIGSFIGIVAMEGHSFYYDLTSDRIGMAESFNCQPKSGLSGFGDDDMFALPTIQSSGGAGPDPWDTNDPWDSASGRGVGPNTASYDHNVGTCTSATCISFVTLGYSTVIVTLAVALKKYRPKDKSKKWDRDANVDDTDTDFGRESETLNPEFRQNARHVEGFA
ncbi:hypothetical protein HJC23_009620 [Cyclotella cryptica]|uniref:Peptidase A1 domain-containing protein n=1 Tax=Cyclotella cryptica TaxID=29204 RepID=A0ABD3PY45_9STRA|eukprot:CCRYP_010889-RB/>CCRYP_010889-RB protein AED:0.14 eAED:0.14 QI:1029/1/1/1/1/1/2/1089/480